MADASAQGIFPYGESELDPIIHAEILTESARTEARLAILEILLVGGFITVLGVTTGTRLVALFCVLTVAPLLVDAYLRRRAAQRLRAEGSVDE